MTNKLLLVMSMLVATLLVNAQKVKWDNPYTGYSNTKNFKIEKVMFTPGGTMVQVVAVGRSGDVFQLSSEAYLSAEGKRYQIAKVKNLKLNRPFTMPDSGKVHVEMIFPAVPSGVKVVHFAESAREYGWKLCNIRPTQEILSSCVPADWTGVTYAASDTLPVSEFCNDTTELELKILNYTPEIGRSFNISYMPIDYDLGRKTWTFDISEDGTAVARIHPCYPLTVYAAIGNSPAMTILVVPGGKLSILVDAGNMDAGFKPIAFKGTLASANYEINTLGYKDIVNYDNTQRHLHALILSGKDIPSQASSRYVDTGSEINKLGCTEATKEWLHMHNMIEYIKHKSHINLYVRRLIGKDLERAGSDILKNNPLYNMATGVEACPEDPAFDQKMCSSDRLTLYPNFLSYSTVYPKSGDASALCWDVHNLHSAAVSDAMYSSAEADELAMKIKDKQLRNYYQEVKNRRLLYVDSIRKNPHIHFDEHGENAFEDIKPKFFSDHKGKYLFLVAYNGNMYESNKVLDVFDSLSCSINKDKSTIACVDMSVVYSGVDKWVESVKGRKCEMYGGLKSRYEQLFRPEYHFGDAGCYFKVYDPEGKCVLSTRNQLEMVNMVKKLMK